MNKVSLLIILILTISLGSCSNWRDGNFSKRKYTTLKSNHQFEEEKSKEAEEWEEKQDAAILEDKEAEQTEFSESTPSEGLVENDAIDGLENSILPEVEKGFDRKEVQTQKEDRFSAPKKEETWKKKQFNNVFLAWVIFFNFIIGALILASFSPGFMPLAVIAVLGWVILWLCGFSILKKALDLYRNESEKDKKVVAQLTFAWIIMIILSAGMLALLIGFLILISM